MPGFGAEVSKMMKKPEVAMEQTKKKISFLKRIKWMCLLFGFIMYISTESVFGLGWATALTVASMAGFYLICDGDSKADNLPICGRRHKGRGRFCRT